MYSEKRDDYNEREEIRKAADLTTYGLAKFVVPVVFAILILALIGVGLMATRVITMSLQRETIRHSNQFVEAKSGFVTQLILEYQTLGSEIAEAEANKQDAIVDAKQAQQKALLQQIHRQGNTIPAMQRPTDIQNFLNRNPIR